MKKAAIALTVLYCLNSSARAEDADQRAIKSEIGKTLWVFKPANKGVEVCATLKNCRWIYDTAFTVLAAVKPIAFWTAKIKTKDGFVGALTYWNRERYSESELHPLARQQLRACEESGRPVLGSPREQVYRCLGFPTHVLNTDTSAGSSEMLYYSGRANVLLSDDKVTAVQSVR